MHILYTFELSNAALLLAELLLESASWGCVQKSPPLPQLAAASNQAMNYTGPGSLNWSIP